MSDPAPAVFGHGPEAALALHCSLARGKAWSGVGECLADRVTLTAPDLLGHGAAPDWDGQGDYFAAARERVQATLRAGPPVHLIGHSFGGVLALSLVEACRDRIERLTLIEPVWFALARGRPGFAGNVAGFTPVHAALSEGRPEDAARLFTAEWGSGVPWEDLPERQRRYMTARIALVAAQQPLLQDADTLVRMEALARLDLDVLLIEGGDSPPVIAEIQKELAARLPRARRVVVTGAGHMLPITHPEAVAAEIARQVEGA